MDTVDMKNTPTFTSEYKPTASFQSDSIQSQVSSANVLIDDLISDYQGHEKAEQGLVRLTKIDSVVRDIFDSLGPSKLTNSEAELLSELCRRLNEDPVLQEIRDTHTDERLSGETVSFLPSINAQQMSSLPGNPTSPKKTAKVGHSKSRLSFMEPKNNSDDIPPLQQEDYHSPPRAVRTELNQPDLQEIERLEEMKRKSIYKLDTEIREIVNHSLTRLDSKRGGDTDRAHKYSMSYEILINKYREMLRNAQEERKRHVDYLFSQMKDEYERHRIEFAHKYYTEINDLLKAQQCSEQSAYLSQKMSENQLLMEDVDYNYQEVLKVITELDDENGYMIEKAKKNTVIKYKNLPGGGISLKLESIVDVPLFNLLALNYEAEGFAKWTPFCKESKLIKRMTKASNAMYMKWEMPPPVSAREGYLTGSGYDRLEINGSILMIAKTIHKDPRAQLRYEIDVPVKSKYVRMEIPYIGTDLVPISKTQTKMRLVTTFDPQIWFVPLSLSSWIARKGSMYLLETIVKYAGSLEGEVWKGYLEKSKEFYDWLKNVLDNHEANKALNA